MLPFHGVHSIDNNNMSSQSKLHSIKETTDFTFCDIPKTEYHHVQKSDNEDSFEFSPPPWSKDVRSDRSNNTRQASSMVEGRKELMEKFEDMPESCYELSLNHMVAKDTKPELREEKKGAKKSSVSRSVSLDTGVFLLKMFVPTSFGLKKHTVPRSTSMDGLQKRPVDAKKWKTWFLAYNKENDGSRSGNSNRGYHTATKNRYAEETLKPGCMFKSTNQKGCIFFCLKSVNN
ncbi:uncharacterized protein [Rutidosis leptorrhynchoides]|uniref:uncharacterized protein n=1 Tax=Rutidosis leptorrhynchoides TaxID=125765 RepID=UPI003A9A3C7D